MNVPTPHYVAYLEASRSTESGQWRFSLQTPDGEERFEAADIEPRIRGDRLDLLTAVRALEALDQPSQVTLMGCGPYVRQGIQYGLPEWRDNGWQWEYYGQMVPVKNDDLWQRLDRALRFHQVELKHRRLDRPHPRPAGPHPVAPCQGVPGTVGDGEDDTRGVRVEQDSWVEYAGSLLPATWRHRLDAAIRRCLRIAARAWEVLARWGDSCTVTPGVAVQLPPQRQVARNVTAGGAERVSA
jgi:ribonuclease HI